ncbi:hypothetical protein [Acetobacterium wieringae]|uniref:hypothetical protein n=1 Tax=Acetobacterium wieringae TaxID=52694 RepID=UPI0031592220
MLSAFLKLSTKSKVLILIFVMSLVMVTFFGNKDAGGITYYDNYYEAGSLLDPNEYTDYGYAALYSGEAGELNRQLGALRNQNLIYVISFGIGAIASLWLLFHENDIKALLLEVRSLSTERILNHDEAIKNNEIDDDITEELIS